MITPPPQFPLASSPYGPAPLRRPGSIRRTSTIDTSWPEGFGQPMVMTGRARDILTPVAGGAPVMLSEAGYVIKASPLREIIEITLDDARPEAQQLVGVRAGGQSRAVLAEVFAADRASGAPLYLILDDFAGASLVAGWAWSRWIEDFDKLIGKTDKEATDSRIAKMTNICTGFASGSSALEHFGPQSMKLQNCARVPALVNSDDPGGWHPIAEQEGVGMRRARRIDVWHEDGAIHIDVGFQDSGTMPDGGERMAVHEYHVSARAEGGILTELIVTPHVLPFAECPGAIAHVQLMVGTPLTQLREAALALLPGALGCTHLNDVVRSMADVSHLAEALE